MNNQEYNNGSAEPSGSTDGALRRVSGTGSPNRVSNLATEPTETIHCQLG